MTDEELQRLIEEVERRETLRIARLLAILELRHRGMSYRSIARVLGMSHEHVRRLLVTFPVTPLDVGEYEGHESG